MQELLEEFKRLSKMWGKMKGLKIPKKGGNMSALNQNMNIDQMSKMLPPQMLKQMGVRAPKHCARCPERAREGAPGPDARRRWGRADAPVDRRPPATCSRHPRQMGARGRACRRQAPRDLLPAPQTCAPRPTLGMRHRASHAPGHRP